MDSETTMTVAEALYNAGYVCAGVCTCTSLLSRTRPTMTLHSYISYPRTETEKFSPEQDLRTLIHEQRNHPAWGTYAAALLDGDAQHPQGRFLFPRNGQKDDQVCWWVWVC